jgi:cyclophilin family peptidyl-prolyl cis-trans isomerase
MIQGGDPKGTGMGGESKWGAPFEMEISPLLHHIRGALSMARTSDPVSQGSQFFIVQGSPMSEQQEEELNYYADNQEEVATEDGGKIKDYFPKDVIDKYLEVGGALSLDYQYTVFGQAFEGIDIVDAIAGVKTDANDKPVSDIVIESVKIETYGGK